MPLALLEGSSALAESSASGSPSSSLNLSPNPVLASDLNGYSIQEGGTNLSRVPVSDHVAASWAAKVTSTGATTRIREPREPVQPGETWTFASDVKARSGAKAQITVSWFNSNGAFLSWSGGSASAVRPSSWTRVGAALTVPAGAATAQTVVNVAGSHQVRLRVGRPARRPGAVDLWTRTTSPTASPTTSPTTSHHVDRDHHVDHAPSPTTSTTPSPTTSPLPSTTSCGHHDSRTFPRRRPR